MAVTIPDAAVLQASKRRDWEAAMRIYFGRQADLQEMVAAYIDGVGSLDDFTLHSIRQKLTSAAIEAGLIHGGMLSVVDATGRLQPDFIQSIRSATPESFYEVVPSDQLSRHTILPTSENGLSSLDIPPAINMVTKLPIRPPVHMGSATGGELCLHPFCYQLIWPDEEWFCPEASNRSLSKPALSRLMAGAENHQSDRDLVIIQDRFPGGNFAHFLFDWVTRIGLASQSGLIDVRNCTFVMGGTPGRFEQLVVDAVMAELHLSEDQFLFPSGAMVLKTTQRVLWFSDQTEQYLHPAQLAHPRSVSFLRTIAKRLHVQPDRRFRRLYMSRMDAGRRRVINEPELVAALRSFEFEILVPSDHTVDHQLELIAGAEVVVSPHGMGLTGLSLHPGTPTLIELHHPSMGTEAYALMASAMKFPYRYVLGKAAGGDFDDFSVSADAVEAALKQLGIMAPHRTPKETAHVSMIPSEQRLTPNPQLIALPLSTPAAPAESADVVWCHQRADPSAIPDSNVGAMTQIAVEPGRFYTASCWVWIPTNFKGSAVRLNIGEWPNQWLTPADLKLRDCWQLITASKTCPPEVDSCNLVLRVTSPEGERIYSSSWMLEAGLASRLKPGQILN